MLEIAVFSEKYEFLSKWGLGQKWSGGPKKIGSLE